jgi:hypothetical protein
MPRAAIVMRSAAVQVHGGGQFQIRQPWRAGIRLRWDKRLFDRRLQHWGSWSRSHSGLSSLWPSHWTMEGRCSMASVGSAQGRTPIQEVEASVDGRRLGSALQAFAGMSLTIREYAAGEAILRRITLWSGVQEAILPRPWTHLHRQLEGRIWGVDEAHWGRRVCVCWRCHLANHVATDVNIPRGG